MNWIIISLVIAIITIVILRFLFMKWILLNSSNSNDSVQSSSNNDHNQITAGQREQMTTGLLTESVFKHFNFNPRT